MDALANGELEVNTTLYHLNRHRDPSGVSGEGDGIATICEFGSGLIAMHWNSETPSVTVYTDIRHIERLHGHEGASTLEITEPQRLLAAYKRVVPWMLTARHQDQPILCEAHPLHPDRLRMVFTEERPWRFWIALLDGSTDAAVHEDIGGETEHRWVSADGNLWCVYHTRHTSKHDHDPIHDPRD